MKSKFTTNDGTMLTRFVSFLIENKAHFTCELTGGAWELTVTKEPQHHTAESLYKTAERGDVHGSFQVGFVYELESPIDDDPESAEYMYFKPCDYALGGWIGDGWIVNAYGDTHPGYDASPVSMQAANLIAHPANCPQCGSNDIMDTGEGDDMVCNTCNHLFDRTDIAPWKFTRSQ